MYGDPNCWAPSQNNYWSPQFKTNKIPVTSLDEAIAKSNERNSEIYYWDQSKPIIYVIKTDMNGVKSWAQLPYTLPNQDTSTPATKADITALASAISDLVKKIEELDFSKATKKKKVETNAEVLDNGEHNG